MALTDFSPLKKWLESLDPTLNVFIFPSRLCPVPPILLPEWLLVPTPGFGRKKSVGPHSGCVGASVILLFFFFLSSCRRACTAPSATASMSGTINRAKVKIQQRCQSSSELLSRCLEEFAGVAAAAAGLSASFKLSNAILQRSSSEAFVVSILWADKWMEVFLLGRTVVFRGFAAV